jgi:hypothetical protein
MPGKRSTLRQQGIVLLQHPEKVRKERLLDVLKELLARLQSSVLLAEKVHEVPDMFHLMVTLDECLSPVSATRGELMDLLVRQANAAAIGRRRGWGSSRR